MREINLLKNVLAGAKYLTKDVIANKWKFINEMLNVN